MSAKSPYQQHRCRLRGMLMDKKTFNNTKNFSYHFTYRHMVDDHNNLRHSTPTLEDTWITKTWEFRVFAFLLAITEVNLYLYIRWQCWRSLDTSDYPNLHQFRKRLAFSLLDNKYIVIDVAEQRQMRSSSKEHKFLRCPKYAKNSKTGLGI